ncbi:M20/M25/M40 family metallo-hydrolase [Chitinophaga caseinilytica]|uniref:M20/M25/M40 family metallo-hydrolase n=1 Tax=Chitinophaga caseinilytica TaxID=2267521 RepID=UPI003C2F8BA2
MKKLYLILPLAGIALTAYPQKKADKKTLGNLQAHVAYLASDKLEGRRTGTPGEQLAATYIAGQMQAIGLSPKGTDGFLQPFLVREGLESGPKARFSINSRPLKAGEQFVPLPFSARKSAKGEVLPGVNEVDNVWLINVKDAKDEINPHGAPLDFYIKKTKEAKESGATGIVFFNGGEDQQTVASWLDLPNETLAIPAIWVGEEGSKTLSADDANGFQIELEADLVPSKRTGTNVVGFIDNSAPATVVIGAHFDHLGYGEDHNSLAPNEKAVHNGADDNASGTAALLEVARLLKESKLKNANYAIVAFSGEELGLFGSKYFAEKGPVSMQQVNFMLNMDMVGRLSAEKGLQIGGYGTSPVWGEVVPGVVPKGLKVSYDSSGLGPSDHASFYLKNVPVLFFFTGTHGDYHKPGDDTEKINFDGELTIVKLVYGIVEKTNGRPKLAFTHTSDPPPMPGTGFTVTLGVMLDYTFKGGAKVESVRDGKPAKAAGLEAGDVIVRLGDYAVTDAMSYTKALSTFKKGDKTSVKVKRGTEEKVFDIQF